MTWLLRNPVLLVALTLLLIASVVIPISIFRDDPNVGRGGPSHTQMVIVPGVDGSPSVRCVLYRGTGISCNWGQP